MVRVHREQSFEFNADARRIWPAIANTNLVSEVFGAGRYEATDVSQPDGSVLRQASGRKLHPIARSWTEDLGEWVYARSCHQRRWFGPEGRHHVAYTLTLEPLATGTRVRFLVEIVASGPVLWLGKTLGLVGRALDRLMAVQVSLIEAEIARTEAAAAHDPLAHLPAPTPAIDRHAERRLATARRTLADLAGEQPLADRLVDHLTRAPDDALARIRPLELARWWEADADRVVDLCLAAHRAGLLSLRWEVLCPNCRNSREPAATLEALPRQVHCSTCNVDYERDFSRNVELLFAPEAWLRPLPAGAACMLGASTTPHIVVQRHVEAGGELRIDPPLRPGAYRIRAPQIAASRDLELGPTARFPEVTTRGERFEIGAQSEDGTLVLRNAGDGRVTFVLEELAWRADALTGDRAIARAAFRRYCPDQLLRPGDDVRIANVVIMFTDLKGSTSLYESIGDAPAYRLVRDHFDFLTRVVESHRGAVVKTMGDAIMAAFSDAADAAAAAVRLQAEIADFNHGRSDAGITLKVGLHQGACIAVTIEGKLDYFGSMVNQAARLQGESRGDDVVLSQSLAEVVDPAGLMPPGQGFDLTREVGDLRGFDRPMAYTRLVLHRAPV